MLEIEMKFYLPDPNIFERKIDDQYQAKFGKTIVERDIFFQHVNRDFTQTDECLRLRIRKGDLSITYKGPKLDQETKSREEIEIPLTAWGDRLETDSPSLSLLLFAHETALSEDSPILLARLADWRTLLDRLGFREAADLTKNRRTTTVIQKGYTVDITLDYLPSIGYFTELEVVAQSPDEMDTIKQILNEMKKTLDLGQSIRQSYLELFNKQRGSLLRT